VTCERVVGQSTGLGIGGNPIIGPPSVDILSLFQADRATKIVATIGEVGGSDEEKTAPPRNGGGATIKNLVSLSGSYVQ
jgi:succinyl-CoA synthetase alpha subunit